jgi:hypothetical protein
MREFIELCAAVAVVVILGYTIIVVMPVVFLFGYLLLQG